MDKFEEKKKELTISDHLKRGNFSKILEIDPENVDALIGVAIKLKNSKEYQKALSKFNEILGLNKIDDEKMRQVLKVMAKCADQLDEIDEIIKIYDQIIDLKPYPDFFVGRANHFYDNNRYLEAIDDFTKALEKQDDDPSEVTLEFRGHSYLLEALTYQNPDKENLENAINDYTEAIKIHSSYDSEPTNLLYERGRAKYHLESYQKAIEDFTKALEKEDDDLSKVIYELRGHCFYMLDDYQNAINDFTEKLKYDPEDTETLFYRAQSYVRGEKNYQLAIDDSRKIFEIITDKDTFKFTKASTLKILDSISKFI